MTDWGPFSLEGRRAVVTGGAMGIGLGIARRFVEAGAAVLLADIDHEAAEREADALRAAGGQAAAIPCDVAAATAGEEVVAAMIDQFGGVDVLVNNAGIFPFVPLLEIERELWERIIAINLTGLAFVSQAVGRRMVDQGSGGAIINIASVDGFHPSAVGLAAYDASKGGVIMFTRALALEMAPHNVRVNAIAPGGVATPGVAAVSGSDVATHDERGEERLPMDVPLRHMGIPDEIATTAVYLASEASSYVTGEAVVVDGGLLIG